MAYSTVDKKGSHFNAFPYDGTGSGTTLTGVGFKPDLFWIKNRVNTQGHTIFDTLRGGGNYWSSQNTNAALSDIGAVVAASDGITFPSGDDAFNGSGSNRFLTWCWKAGGDNPTKTYKVVVVSDSGNKYRFRNSTDTATFGASAVTLDLQEGGTYTFDVSDSTMDSHPFVIGTAANSSEYSTGVTYKLDGVTKTYSQYTSGFSAATTRQLIITVAASAPALYYWCSQHSGMGGAINTNATTGSSNFDGSVQTKVTTNSTAGFSIINFTGTGSGGATIGHGLGETPACIWIVNMNDSSQSARGVYHHKAFDTASNPNIMYLNNNSAEADDTNVFHSTTTFDSSKFSVGDYNGSNGSGDSIMAYAWAQKTGFSHFGEYTGNGNAWGPFVHCGFKPEFVIIRSRAGDDWRMISSGGNSRNDENNDIDKNFYAQSNSAENSTSIDFHSNGFKILNDSAGVNTNGQAYIFMAWGQTIVGSNNMPATAR